MIFPKKLEKGDTIGLISTSSSVVSMCPKRFNRGIKELENLGFKVKLGRNVAKKEDYLAGTIEERLEDFHTMIKDNEVKAIINTIGGFNSNQLIDRLDYNLIKKHPKIILGYSDFTAVLLAIHKKTDLVTFLGPAVLPQFGEWGGVEEYTKNMFFNILVNPLDKLEIQPSNTWVSEFLAWDKDDNRKKARNINHGPRVVKEGTASGHIIAGNMGTMMLLAGTPFFPDFTDSILFIEDDDEEKPATIDRYLFHFRNAGVFNRIKGLVVGRFHTNVNFSSNRSLEKIILEATDGFDFPIITDLDFGHTDPMLTLPNGIDTTIEAKEGKLKLRFNEKAVI